MQTASFSEGDITNWHTNFERMEPEEHQNFSQPFGERG